MVIAVLPQRETQTLCASACRQAGVAHKKVSNPIRYPRFRASASRKCQCAAFAFGVPQDINGFHPYTLSSAHLSLLQSHTVSNADFGLSPKI